MVDEGVRRETERQHTVGGGCRGEISSAGSSEGACRKARSGGRDIPACPSSFISPKGQERERERRSESRSLFFSLFRYRRGEIRFVLEGERVDGERATVRASATEIEGERKRRSMGAVAATATRPPSPSVSHPIVNSKAVPDPSPCVLVRESCFTRCFWLLYSARGC